MISNHMQSKKLGLHNFVKSFPPLASTSIGRTLHIRDIGNSRAFDMAWVISRGVRLQDFADSDYRYVANFDVIFVEKGTRLYTWLALKS